jgi:hypothetical protein
MIKIENIDVYGFKTAIRGMRNPMNSWEKSDSHVCLCDLNIGDCAMFKEDHEPAIECNDGKFGYCVGVNDLGLMQRLFKGGTEHRKYLRMITVTMDITAPLYWWKEFDTYKVGTVANSCSTMHKIHAKEFELDDFSHEHLDLFNVAHLEELIKVLNSMRNEFILDKNKHFWWQMIQLLPTSYNQKRTVQMNYEVAVNIIRQRKNHKLDEWHCMVKVLMNLPYMKEIMGCE